MFFKTSLQVVGETDVEPVFYFEALQNVDVVHSNRVARLRVEGETEKLAYGGLIRRTLSPLNLPPQEGGWRPRADSNGRPSA